MTEVSSIMAKICNINFWIENDPPPLWNFSENSSVSEGVGVPKGGISQSRSHSDTPQLIGWGEDYLLEWTLIYFTTFNFLASQTLSLICSFLSLKQVFHMEQHLPH